MSSHVVLLLFSWSCLTCLSQFDFFRNVLWQYLHTLFFAFLPLLILTYFFTVLQMLLNTTFCCCTYFTVFCWTKIQIIKWIITNRLFDLLIFRSTSSCTFMLVSIKVSGELLITSPAGNFHDCRVLKKCFLCFIQILLFFVTLKIENFFKKKTLHWQWLVRIMHQCFAC